MGNLLDRYRRYREDNEARILEALENEDIDKEEAKQQLRELMDWDDFQNGYADAHRED